MFTTANYIMGHQVSAGALCNSEMHQGLDAGIYHAGIDSQSCSLLKAMLTSPAHYKAQFFAQRTNSPSMDFGTLIHNLVLEPGSFSKEYAVYPGKRDGRSQEFKTFCGKNPGRTVIDEVEFRSAKILADKILDRVVVGRPFGDWVSEGTPEATVYYDDPTTGVRCRVRIDLWHPEVTFDLKTTIHAHSGTWLRQALSLHYDMQAYMYSLAATLYSGCSSPKPFVFIAAESDVPHSVSVYTAGSSFIENGGKKYQSALGGYTACARVNHWPDAGSDTVLEINHWQAVSDRPSWMPS